MSVCLDHAPPNSPNLRCPWCQLSTALAEVGLLREIYGAAKADIQARGPELVGGAVSGIGLNNALQRLRESLAAYEFSIPGGQVALTNEESSKANLHVGVMPCNQCKSTMRCTYPDCDRFDAPVSGTQG